MVEFIKRMYFKPCTALALIFLLCFKRIETAQILALFINGHRSHLLAYAPVINLLTKRGHNLTVVTTLDITNIGLNTDNIRWIKLSDGYTKLTTTDNGSNKIQTMLERIKDTSKFMDDPLWHKFIHESQRYDLLLLGYLFNDYQLGVAAHFNCPAVIMWTGQSIGFIHSLMGNPEERWYVTQPYDLNQFTGLRAIVFGWFDKIIEMMALHKMKNIYNKHFPGPKYPTFKEIRKSVSLVLCHHHSLSEGPIAPYLPTFIEIGGLENVATLPNNKEFNQTKESNIIYISFGSRVKWSSLPNSLELEFLEAFKAFPDYTIMWTYDKNCTEHLLQSKVSNIKCKSWWPQTSILASNQTKLFITHGGKASISEALLNGKPILGIPIFGDQNANVLKMINKKIGLKLTIENVTVDNLIKALRELLENPIYKTNADNFSKLYRDRPLSSEDNAVYWLEYVIRYKGAKHLRSPALDLNAIEYYLVDLYFVMFLSFFLIIVLCNYIENKLKRNILR